MLQVQQEGEDMILRFNDATELRVQNVELLNGQLRVLTIGKTPEELRNIFTDKLKTKVIRVEEREQMLGSYENYTEYDHTEEYPSGIYGIVMNQVGKSYEERLQESEQGVQELKKEVENANTRITDVQMAVCEMYEAKKGV